MCSGLSVQASDAESISPPLVIYEARERAAPLSALHASRDKESEREIDR